MTHEELAIQTRYVCKNAEDIAAVTVVKHGSGTDIIVHFLSKF